MMKTREFRLVAVALAAVLAAVLMAALVAASSQAAGRKPDLVVTDFPSLKSRNYVFSGELSKYSFSDTTKNSGSAKAGRSKTALVLRDSLLSADPGLAVARRDVPSLLRGRSNTGSGVGIKIPSKSQIGAYYALVCADRSKLVKESNENNNCKNTNERLSIIPRSWSGSFSGHAEAVPGVIETWSAPQVTFEFDSYLEPYFNYTANGDVNINISGTDDTGCTWSGGGTITLRNSGTLRVDSNFATYDGWAAVTDPVYTITISCPNTGERALDGPWSSLWLYTGTPSQEIADPVGVASLAGEYSIADPTGGESVHWWWNLSAD
jgi:CARDB